MTRSDERLLRELRSPRRHEAAQALYRSYGDELFAFAVRRLRDRELAEEVVQDVFVRGWRAAAAYDPERGSVRTWLYAIARNAIVDVERRRARRAAPGANEPDAPTTEPIEAALLRWQVQLALGRLTEDHREVIRLAHLTGLSTREIADRLAIPEGTVKSRLYYAMRSLRLALEEMGITP